MRHPPQHRPGSEYQAGGRPETGRSSLFGVWGIGGGGVGGCLVSEALLSLAEVEDWSHATDAHRSRRGALDARIAIGPGKARRDTLEEPPSQPSAPEIVTPTEEDRRRAGSFSFPMARELHGESQRAWSRDRGFPASVCTTVILGKRIPRTSIRRDSTEPG